MQELQKKKIPAQTVICMEHMGAHSEIGKVYHDLNAWAQKNGAKAQGPCFTAFLIPPNEYDAASGHFEVCMPVAGEPKGDDAVRVKQLPACTVAFSQVKGSYSQIPAHYTEMLAWLDAQGLEAAGAPREVYLKRPAKGGAGDYLTEIQFPIAD